MDLTSLNAFERALAAKFEHQPARTQTFPVRIDAFISQTVQITASTAEEAKLKAKQVAQEIFDKDLHLQARE